MGKKLFNDVKTPLSKKEVMFERADLIRFDDDIDPRELPPEQRRKLLLLKKTKERFVPKPVDTSPKPADPKPADPAPKPEETVKPAENQPLDVAPKEEPAATKVKSDDTVRNLISAIPIAAPGGLITDEYHNSLRSAVRALGERLGLSISPDSEFNVLSFAPNFLPVKQKNKEIANLNWNVTLERAAIPALTGEDLSKPVAGGFVLQLPDVGEIDQMFVWATKAKDSAKPREFNVTLNRKRLGSSDPAQQLILIDLKETPDGAFFKSAELSEREISLLDEDEGETGTTKISTRRRINNEKWIYFVEAEFIAGGETAAEKYEINAIQIYCYV